jgi:hypothetical protein
MSSERYSFMSSRPASRWNPGTLEISGHATQHSDLGPTSWYTVRAGDKSAARGAWMHTGLPAYARELEGRVAFAWPAMDGFFEEEERSMGHAADSYHRIDIRQSPPISWFGIVTASSPI